MDASTPGDARLPEARGQAARDLWNHTGPRVRVFALYSIVYSKAEQWQDSVMGTAAINDFTEAKGSRSCAHPSPRHTEGVLPEGGHCAGGAEAPLRAAP